MKTLQRFKQLVLLCPLTCFMVCSAESIVWRSTIGDLHLSEIDATESFSDVIARLQMMDANPINDSNEYFIDFMVANNVKPKASHKANNNIVRVYEQQLTEQNREDISYIVTTLGNGSLTSIATSKSSLKRAGERVEKVHPLQFLQYVFTDEKLKAAMHNLKGRTLWIWSEFFNGLKGSLEEETRKQNLNQYVDEFSTTIGLKISVIQPSFDKKDWKELMDILLTNIPRSGNPGRYNM